MVVLERRLKGVLPYRVIFFPTDGIVRQVAQGLELAAMARLFSTNLEIGPARRLVHHYTTATTIIDLTKDLDLISRRMQASTRNKISKAERVNGRVEIERNEPRTATDFLELYNDLFRQKNGRVLNLAPNVLARYAGYSDIFLLRLDGTAFCGHINLRDEDAGRERLLYSVTRRFEDRDTARLGGILNSYLHWREMQTYKEEGFCTYDFGGVSRGDDPSASGIDQFKLGFGGTTVTEHNYLCAGLPILGRALLRLFGLGQNR